MLNSMYQNRMVGTGEAIASVNGKVQGITERLRPNNWRELRSFLEPLTS